VQFLRKWAIRLILAVALVLGTLIIGGAVDARLRHPDLQPWHQMVPDDLGRADMGDTFTLEQWLARESTVFAEVEALESRLTADERSRVNRYYAGSATHYSRLGRNWNRTFEFEPAEVRGAAVLIHGLTDSPYSMRAVAEVLRDQGYYTLALRMPGHGTVPAGLLGVDWEDWLAAVRVGMRHARQKVGPGKPLVLVGYSNGGALAVKYAAEALDRPQDPRAARLLLISPMIGVTPAARLAWWISRLGDVPYFEKARWLDVAAEFNPIKYNSFPANAGFQTMSLTSALQADIERLTTAGRASELPSILTFQSAVDATVSTAAVVQSLYDRLPDNGSELVLFDVNHQSGIDAFVRPANLTLVQRLFDRAPRAYRRTLITNRSPATVDVVARTIQAGAQASVDEDTGLAWPFGVFSLTHIALPFPTDDPLYGTNPVEDGSGLLRLGSLSPRGERAVLITGTDTLMRLSSNPFFPYMAARVRDWARAN
jgi:alpha-beta hydrolase superfamily lysophospholipase